MLVIGSGPILDRLRMVVQVPIRHRVIGPTQLGHIEICHIVELLTVVTLLSSKA